MKYLVGFYFYFLFPLKSCFPSYVIMPSADFLFVVIEIEEFLMKTDWFKANQYRLSNIRSVFLIDMPTFGSNMKTIYWSIFQ